MQLTDDSNDLKITKKSKSFCAIKGDNVISLIGAPLQTLGAPNTPLWIVHSVKVGKSCALCVARRAIYN